MVHKSRGKPSLNDCGKCKSAGEQFERRKSQKEKFISSKEHFPNIEKEEKKIGKFVWKLLYNTQFFPHTQQPPKYQPWNRKGKNE